MGDPPILCCSVQLMQLYGFSVTMATTITSPSYVRHKTSNYLLSMVENVYLYYIEMRKFIFHYNQNGGKLLIPYSINDNGMGGAA